MRTWAGLAIVLVATVAQADPRNQIHGTVPIDNEHANDDVPRLLWLNRCAGGCTITQGGNDAATHHSAIPKGPDGGTFTISEFDQGDAKWAALVTCVKEVYSPYNVMVTDVKPVGQTYNEAIVAGDSREIGWDAGGVAPVGCDPYNNVISFSFAKQYGSNMLELCATVAQETGHAYSMAHEYEFLDGMSACTDPMTYRQDCGGQQFFRNKAAYCGEYARATSCLCGTTSQNSHLHLLSALGPGTPITTPPVISYVTPPAGTVITNATQPIIGIASAQRGIEKVELWINGYKWAEVKGVAFGPGGQPEADYQIAIPAGVPDSVIDVELVAKDDIDVAMRTPVVRLTKNKACSGDDSCLDGQTCDADGRCVWAPAAGEFGDACTYDQFCKSGICNGICTLTCVPGVGDSCETGYTCVQPDDGGPVCEPAKGSAAATCCSVGDSRAVALQSGLIALAFLVGSRGRRRRKR